MILEILTADVIRNMSYMADPLTLMLLGSALSATPMLANMFPSQAERMAKRTGAEQKQRGQSILDSLVRPEMGAEVNALSSILSGNLGISDTERTVAETNINRATAAGTQGVSSLGGGLRQVGALTEGGQNAMGNLSATSGAIERQNKLNLEQLLASALGNQEFFNVISPFLESRQEGQALLGAGMQNEYLAALMKNQRFTQGMQGVGAVGSTLLSQGISKI